MSAKLIALPTGGFAPTNEALAKALRAMADNLDGGSQTDEDAAPIRRVVMVFETVEGTIHRRVIGGHTSVTETIGLLFQVATLASTRAQDWEETGDE